MLEIGDLITLYNDNEYIVTKIARLENREYIALITKDGLSEFLICEHDNGKLKIVKDEAIVIKLLEIFK